MEVHLLQLQRNMKSSQQCKCLKMRMSPLFLPLLLFQFLKNFFLHLGSSDPTPTPAKNFSPNNLPNLTPLGDLETQLGSISWWHLEVDNDGWSEGLFFRPGVIVFHGKGEKSSANSGVLVVFSSQPPGRKMIS